MSEPIIATKLYIPPPRPKAVLRPRLVECLNNGLLGKLTIISAPAGFGKTTVVSQWLRSAKRPATWLSLDESDDDPSRFLNYIVAALQKIEPSIGVQILAELQSPQPPPLESLLAVLLNDIANLADSFILVLDDYHIIDSKPIDNLITFLLEHFPTQLHLLITTREDPDLPLARLRARGELTELRATDLRFTLAEATEFLNQTMGLKLSEKDIYALEARTEGWIVGLQLAALSMQGPRDVTSFIKTFTGNHHFVLDYLLEETLQQQSEAVQNFLLTTSILERLSGPLCDVVLPNAAVSGQETLELIEQANLFVIPLDDRREWYRYHHLFADVLQARLLKLKPEIIPLLHQRASVWFEQNGQHQEAIQHALAAEDFEQAAKLCEVAWPDMDRYTQSAPWLDWVKAIPIEIVRCRPVLMLHYAWALLDIGELEEGEDLVEEVEAYLDYIAGVGEHKKTFVTPIIVDEKQFDLLRSNISSARAYIAQTLGNIPAAIKFTQQTLGLLPDEDHYRRSGTTVMLGLAYFATGDLDVAYQTFADSLMALRKTGYIDDTIGGTFILADIKTLQGCLRNAASLYEQSIQLLPQHEPFPQGTAYLYLGLSNLHREWGNTEVARLHLQRAVEINEKTPLQLCQYRLSLAQAHTIEDQGDLETALTLLGKAEQFFYRNVVPDFRPVSAMKARVLIRQKKFNEAIVWVHERELSVYDEPSFLREFEHITLLRLLIAQYKNDGSDTTFDDAMKFSDKLIQAAEENGRTNSILEIYLQQALVCKIRGEIDAALTMLNKALAIAQPEAYVRIFISEGSDMAQLLSKVSISGVMSDYVNKLLAVFETDQKSNQIDSSAPVEQMLMDPLSKRELEVLGLIAEGFSNQEISKKLYLALSSVKGHNQKIFAKLQVQRRTEAVARARELELL